MSTRFEPNQLYMMWTPRGSEYPFRVGVLRRTEIGIVSLDYLVNTRDFEDALEAGFAGYPAFPDFSKTHYRVMGTLSKRLCSRARGDYKDWLESVGLPRETKCSSFALLAYSHGKLLSDGFSFSTDFGYFMKPGDYL